MTYSIGVLQSVQVKVGFFNLILLFLLCTAQGRYNYLPLNPPSRLRHYTAHIVLCFIFMTKTVLIIMFQLLQSSVYAASRSSLFPTLASQWVARGCTRPWRDTPGRADPMWPKQYSMKWNPTLSSKSVGIFPR